LKIDHSGTPLFAILDYGMANLRSVQKAFALLGHDAQIINSPEAIDRADQLVVPGVGAFKDAIAVLNERGLADAIRAYVKAGKPLLGICLGLQLLFDVGYEDGEHRGMGIVAGDCVRLTVDQPSSNGADPLKVPHIGWNSLQSKPNARLFAGLPADSYAYFVHSYHVRPKDANVIACTVDYGGPIVAAIEHDNVLATQFHPEKSQRVGQKILDNFAAI
jgi:glutamine amidotransferase